jgi:hypothetical protein
LLHFCALLAGGHFSEKQYIPMTYRAAISFGQYLLLFDEKAKVFLL